LDLVSWALPLDQQVGQSMTDVAVAGVGQAPVQGFGVAVQQPSIRTAREPERVISVVVIDKSLPGCGR
jgi:hypothetical protein